jgi:biotin operon repressor
MANKRSKALDAAKKMLPPIPANARDLEHYNPASLRDQNEEALTRQYKQMRDTIRKRIDRMRKAGYALPDTYRKGMALFPPVSKIANSRDLRYRLSDSARFLAMKTTSVSEIRKTENKTLKSLQNAGYNINTPMELKAFGKFMELMRERYGKKLMGFPSDQVAAAWEPEDTLSADGFSAADTVDQFISEQLFGDDEDY